ncbi:hypothetical protein T440DRAFT_58713 [Plenodomus tracheiphilus IPT5]|uniref:Uncharacterized protein n=1 Tax=Plenodomus tracheiphilus IPT5 TaxID=1408161 RepID=A0A6A7BAP8_9PLEO|nr:hypothetical protein T440DRAFT_58713 [Plenodomus tracheiphilus IPT5]
MSQPSTPFDGVAFDPFLQSSNHHGQQQQQLLSREELENLFTSHQNLHFPNNSEVFDDLDFSFDNASLAQINLSTASTISTPDFSTYSFGNAALAYPTPGPNSPQPYPLDVKHSSHYLSNTHPALLSSGPPHLRSNTTTPYLNPPQPNIRRRSLSQGDADRIAAANTISNPTFVRLQAPRARSTTPEEKRRGAPYAQHSRSSSQGPGPRGRPMKQPTTPYGRHGSPLVGGMFSTPIGTPLDDVMEVDDSVSTGSPSGLSRSSHFAQDALGSSNLHTRENSPIIKRMMRPGDLARSKQIIHIGAMTTRKFSNLDPNLPATPPVTHHERILKKLDDVEHHLSQENGYNADALRGCKMIREALAKKMEMDIINKESEEMESDTLDAPSTVFSDMDCSFMGACDDDNELMKLLMQENDMSECKGGSE